MQPEASVLRDELGHRIVDILQHQNFPKDTEKLCRYSVFIVRFLKGVGRQYDLAF